MSRPFSQHVSTGGHSSKHNLREDYRATLEHVDGSMSHLNEVLVADGLRAVYTELFGDAVKEYNARQKRNDRKIEDYYARVRDDARGHKGVQNKDGKRVAYEHIVGVGNRDTFSPSDPANIELAKAVYTDYLHAFQEQFPQLRVFEAVVHFDEPEGGIHMHLAYVPWGEGYKRGMDRQQSLSKACENMGFNHMELDGKCRALLEEVCLRHDITRLDMGNHEHHKPTPQFKREQRELERVQAQAARAKEELASVMHESNAARRERGELQRGNNVLKDRQRQIAGDVRGMQRERVELRGQIETAITELAAAERKATEAQNRADSWTVAAGVMEERAREYTIKADDATAEAQKAAQERDNARTEVDALKAEKTALTHDLAEMRLHYSTEMSEMIQGRNDAAAERDQAIADRDAMIAELNDWRSLKVGVDEVALETKPLPFGYVSVKAEALARVQEQAKAYCANRDQVDGCRTWHDELNVWETNLEQRDRNVTARERSVSVRERDARELYESQVSINETLEETRADLSWARSDLKQAQAKIAAVEQERDGLRAELEKARETIGTLKEKLTTAWTVCANIVKAARMLKYDKEEGFAVPDLPARAGKLLDSLASYAARWLRREQHSDLAESVEERIGLSPGIQKEVDPPQQQKAKSHSRGAR